MQRRDILDYQLKAREVEEYAIQISLINTLLCKKEISFKEYENAKFRINKGYGIKHFF